MRDQAEQAFASEELNESTEGFTRVRRVPFDLERLVDACGRGVPCERLELGRRAGGAAS